MRRLIALNLSRYWTLLALLVAATLAAGLFVLVGTKPVEAAFPGENGKIAFASDRTKGSGVDNTTGDHEIFAVNPEGSTLQQLTINTATDLAPVWSSDGSKIAFLSDRDHGAGSFDYDIYVMNSDGSNQTHLTAVGSTVNRPTFSPDGSKIAFARDNEIFVINTSGSNETNLTNSVAAFESHPAFSPDGTKIAFESREFGTDGEIYVMNAEGSNHTNITNNEDEEGDQFSAGLDWSPDGTKIAFIRYLFSSTGQNPEIFVMNADGSSETRLTETTGGVIDNHPAFSPDGTKIAFTSDRNGPNQENFEIYMMNADGSNETRLTSTGANDAYPNWQPCKGICSVTPADGARKVRRLTDVSAKSTEEMDASTLTTSTFTLTQDKTGIAVEAAVSYDEATKTVTLDPFPDNPTQKLSRSTTYTAKISGAKDEAGNLLPDKIWFFKTGRK